MNQVFSNNLKNVLLIYEHIVDFGDDANTKMYIKMEDEQYDSLKEDFDVIIIPTTDNRIRCNSKLLYAKTDAPIWHDIFGRDESTQLRKIIEFVIPNTISTPFIKQVDNLQGFHVIVKESTDVNQVTYQVIDPNTK